MGVPTPGLWSFRRGGGGGSRGVPKSGLKPGGGGTTPVFPVARIGGTPVRPVAVGRGYPSQAYRQGEGREMGRVPQSGPRTGVPQPSPRQDQDRGNPFQDRTCHGQNTLRE